MQELRRVDRIAPLYPSGGLFCPLRPSYKQGQSGKEAQGGNAANAEEANAPPRMAEPLAEGL